MENRTTGLPLRTKIYERFSGCFNGFLKLLHSYQQHKTPMNWDKCETRYALLASCVRCWSPLKIRDVHSLNQFLLGRGALYLARMASSRPRCFGDNIYFEDTDFCYRTKKLGYKVVYNPDTFIYHHKHGSANNNNLFINRIYFYTSMLKFLFKYRSHYILFNYVLYVVMVIFVVLMLFWF